MRNKIRTPDRYGSTALISSNLPAQREALPTSVSNLSCYNDNVLIYSITFSSGKNIYSLYPVKLELPLADYPFVALPFIRHSEIKLIGRLVDVFL